MSNRLYLDEVRRFECCEYALEEFRHSEHLKVAWTYIRLYGYEAAVSRMRAGLQRFSAYHNKSGYNETITVFWMRKLQQQCAEDLREMPKDTLFLYYMRERVMSEEAKKRWIEPDLLPL